MSPAIPTRDDVQGWVLSGYNYPFSRHHVVAVHDRMAVRSLLRDAVTGTGGVTQIQSALPWGERPPLLANVGFTHSGLAALGVGRADLDRFPTDFRMGAARRAIRVGDFGDNAPNHWDVGTRDSSRAHLLWSMHGLTIDDLDRGTAELAGLGSALDIVATYDGTALPDNVVHFGYVDGLAQPRIAGFHEPAGDISPLGAFFLGHPSQFEGVIFDMPSPTELVTNATFNAFRVLEQDVFAFEDFLDDAADQTGRNREWVAAKICGRWRNGNSLVTHPDVAGEPDDPTVVDTFGFGDDPRGEVCPFASHIRRVNPRDGEMVTRSANNSRRVIRRGMPYGPLIEPGQPRDDVARGLIGNFFCASLTAQFEGLQHDWINQGLHHPNIVGTNDPISGFNGTGDGVFTIPMADEPDIILRGFDTFTRTRASVYTIMPTLSALRWLVRSA
ncbi:MAG: hypothetical protein HKN94_14435 [Acidimicrobiales bacterium]|nr:hypothetical protein [Acidimicrobiales bacterium]RZV46180.1 MAG: hypothetical protein EX269_08015 [Acidimicrobiales bacterium]